MRKLEFNMNLELNLSLALSSESLSAHWEKVWRNIQCGTLPNSAPESNLRGKFASSGPNLRNDLARNACYSCEHASDRCEDGVPGNIVYGAMSKV